jgi:hypothetical protein
MIMKFSIRLLYLSDSEAEFTVLYQKAIENTKQLAAAVTQIGAMDQVNATIFSQLISL